MTTISFPAHQDDDLLFMNPDIYKDIKSGEEVWVCYMTAGDVAHRDSATYTDARIKGVRAAYAQAAGLPNSWNYELMYFAGIPIATNRLTGSNLRLLFTYIHAAGNPADPCGDLARMWNNPYFVSRRMDGRPGYTQSSLVSAIREMISVSGARIVRMHSTRGHREGDHIDHTAAALIVAKACTSSGKTVTTREEYLGYAMRNFPDNVPYAEKIIKKSIWDKYWPYDPELNSLDWQDVMGKQYSPNDGYYPAGSMWSPPEDFLVPC